jgi:serine protease inhibitor
MDDNIEARDEVAAVAGGNSLFGSRLYQQLREEEGNIIMSPFSVSGVMAMVSRHDGTGAPLHCTACRSGPGRPATP